MSLRIWLPLTKDLRQQGLDNVTVTNNGAVYSATGGKLGGCYSFGTGNSYITVDSTSLKTFTEFSFTCWVKIISWNTSYSTIFAAKNSTGVSWNNLIFSLLRNASTSTLCFNISNGSNYTATSCQTGTLSLNTWYHIVCTYKNGEIKLYQDGNVVNTYSTSIIPNFNSIVNLWLGKSNESSYQSNNLLNDVRVYDHCLSPMEVKQISQGLILHYTLSDKYTEGTTNLVTTEDGLSNTCYNGATSKYGYGTNTDMYKTVGTFKNRKCTKVYMGTAGLSAYPYIYFDAFSAAGTTVHTLSFDYFPTLQNTIIPYSYNGTYNFSYTINGISGSATNVSQIIIPVVVGKWNHITITAQKYDTTNASRGIGYIRIGSTSHTSTTSNYWLFSNVQVETKNHATGYAGVGGTRTSTTIYDSSGFCNNGVINGTLSISDDTSKYEVSTIFASGNNYIDCGASQTILPTDGLTASLWVNYSTWGNPISCTEGGGWNFENSSGIQFPVYVSGVGYKVANSGVVTSTLQNDWHMLTGTFDKTSVKIYIDGVLKATTATGSTNGVGYAANHCYVGAEASGGTSIASATFVGKMSDFRIYATALSAADVKSLYQNSAYIDSSGNVYGAVHTEV